MGIVAMIGNVADTPELRTTTGGRSVCSFRVAVSRPGGEQADFFTVVAWERQAEVCAEYLTTGRRVGIEGRVHVMGTADVPDFSIVANRVELLNRA